MFKLAKIGATAKKVCSKRFFGKKRTSVLHTEWRSVRGDPNLILHSWTRPLQSLQTSLVRLGRLGTWVCSDI